MKAFTVESSQPFIKGYNGQRATLNEEKIVVGRSGATKMYDLAAGGALFLHDDEVKPA